MHTFNWLAQSCKGPFEGHTVRTVTSESISPSTISAYSSLKFRQDRIENCVANRNMHICYLYTLVGVRWDISTRALERVSTAVVKEIFSKVREVF
jgi:hypothetical protein